MPFGRLMLWLECDMFPVGSEFELAPQLVVLFGEIVNPLGHDD